jgi:hypothetical protein
VHVCCEGEKRERHGAPTCSCEKGVEVVGPALLAGPTLGLPHEGGRVALLRPHLARQVRAAGG